MSDHINVRIVITGQLHTPTDTTYINEYLVTVADAVDAGVAAAAGYSNSLL